MLAEVARYADQIKHSKYVEARYSAAFELKTVAEELERRCRCTNFETTALAATGVGRRVKNSRESRLYQRSPEVHFGLFSLDRKRRGRFTWFWKPNRMLLECDHCGAVVDAEEIAKFTDDDPDMPFDRRYTFAKCPACNGALLATQLDSGEGWEEPVRVYPPRDRELGFLVPKGIRHAFAEARTCFRAKAYTAAAIMCRKTLEGICSAHGVKSSGTLSAQLKKLKENGTIENRLFEWAEELRTMGNEAAHGVEVVISPEDARDTLEFTEALVEYVFTYRHQFEEFKKRRAKANSPPSEKQKAAISDKS